MLQNCIYRYLTKKKKIKCIHENHIHHNQTTTYTHFRGQSPSTKINDLTQLNLLENSQKYNGETDYIRRLYIIQFHINK